jgi:hypothetical protein
MLEETRLSPTGFDVKDSTYIIWRLSTSTEFYSCQRSQTNFFTMLRGLHMMVVFTPSLPKDLILSNGVNVSGKSQRKSPRVSRCQSICAVGGVVWKDDLSSRHAYLTAPLFFDRGEYICAAP